MRPHRAGRFRSSRSRSPPERRPSPRGPRESSLRYPLLGPRRHLEHPARRRWSREPRRSAPNTRRPGARVGARRFGPAPRAPDRPRGRLASRSVRLPLPSPLTSIGAPLATAIVRGARTRFGRADRAGGGAAGNGGTTSAGVRCRHARSRILANHERRLARIRFARSREVRQERKRNVNGDRRYKRDRDSPPRSPDAAHLSSNASKASVVTGRRLPPRFARES